MGGFFNPESRFWRPFSYFLDIFLLSICWLLCSVPVFTVGAATTALYDAVVHTIRFGEGGTYARFFRTFRREFVLSTLSWLLWAAIWAGCFFLLRTAAQLSSMLLMAGLVLMLLPTGIICWVFPILSRFTHSFASLNKTAVAFAGLHILTTLVIALSTAAAIYLCAWLWLPTLFMPALLVLFWSVFIERVFRKYMPEDDEA